MEVEIEKIKYGALLSSIDMNRILDSIEDNINNHNFLKIGGIPIAESSVPVDGSVLLYDKISNEFKFSTVSFHTIGNVNKIRGFDIEESELEKYDVVYFEDGGFKFSQLCLDNLDNCFFIQGISIDDIRLSNNAILIYNDNKGFYEIIDIIDDRIISQRRVFSTKKINKLFVEIEEKIKELEDLSAQTFENLDRIENVLIPKYKQMVPEPTEIPIEDPPSGTPSPTYENTYFSSEEGGIGSFSSDFGSHHGRGYILEITSDTIINKITGYGTTVDIGIVEMNSDWESGRLLFGTTINGEKTETTGGIIISGGTKICVFAICPNSNENHYGFSSNNMNYHELINTSNHQNISSVTTSNSSDGGYTVEIDGVGNGRAQDWANTTLKARNSGAPHSPYLKIES